MDKTIGTLALRYGNAGTRRDSHTFGALLEFFGNLGTRRGAGVGGGGGGGVLFLRVF